MSFLIPVYVQAASVPGYSPSDIKNAYQLPQAGGAGTIAIIDAYDNPNAEQDLNIFSQQFNLPSCTKANGCFSIHYQSGTKPQYDPGWAEEEDIDIEMAHAIAPSANIELAEVNSENSSDLISGINFARGQSGVVAISMSWGDSEFDISNEENLEDIFTGSSGVSFFASTGDSGHGTVWPSVSSNVIAVGGTSLNLNGSTVSETAWGGSGGGLSIGIPEPSYQSQFGIPNANGRRGVPDVSMVANPNTGVATYFLGRWHVAGGTSVGAPIWAGIRALGQTPLTPAVLYQTATTNYAQFYRDITSGRNGLCGAICTATTGYDYVTGLGSPLGLQTQPPSLTGAPTSPTNTPVPTSILQPPTPSPSLACIGPCGCNGVCPVSPTGEVPSGTPVSIPAPRSGWIINSCNFWHRFLGPINCTCFQLFGYFAICFPALF